MAAATVLLLAVSWTAIRLFLLWSEFAGAAWLKGAHGHPGIRLACALLSPFLLGALWARPFAANGRARPGRMAWPAVWAMLFWWLLLIAFLVWTAGPLLAGMVGAPSRSHTPAERLSTATALALPGLLLTAYFGHRLASSRRAPRPRGASLVAAGLTLLAFGIPFVAYERRLRAQIARAESATNPDDVLREIGESGYGGSRRWLLRKGREGGSAGVAATRALYQLPGGPGGVDELAREALAPGQVRAAAVALLRTEEGRERDASLLAIAAELLHSLDPEVRLAMTQGLPALSWSIESVPLLHQAVRDPDPRVRFAAALRLRGIDAKAEKLVAAEAFCELLGNAARYPTLGEVELRCSALQCAVYRPAQASESLLGLLADPSLGPELREVAIRVQPYLPLARDRWLDLPAEVTSGCST